MRCSYLYPIKACNSIEEAVNVRNAHPSTWDSEGGDGYAEIWNLETLEILD